MKHKSTLLLRLKDDSHMHNPMNFFHLWMDKISTPLTSDLEVHVGQTSGIVEGKLLALTH
jgi:hypothetical protein